MPLTPWQLGQGIPFYTSSSEAWIVLSSQPPDPAAPDFSWFSWGLPQQEFASSEIS
jgi:hypothetical protein